MRPEMVSKALESFSALSRVINEMTEDEVLAALDLESRAARRWSIVDRLIKRAARLNEIRYVAHLKEKFYG